MEVGRVRAGQTLSIKHSQLEDVFSSHQIHQLQHSFMVCAIQNVLQEKEIIVSEICMCILNQWKETIFLFIPMAIFIMDI